MEKFECECGRVFNSATSRNSHYRFCDVHIPIKKYDENGKCISKSKYKISDDLYRCECGKEFDNHQSLNAHFGHCDYHYKCMGTKRKGHSSELTHSMCWFNKSEEEIKEIHKKSGKTLSENIKNGKVIPSFTNKRHKEESKDKLSEGVTGAKKYEKPREKKLKFTYQEAKDYETIEADMAKLEEKIEKIDSDILSAARDFVKLNELTKEKEALQSELDSKMERWMYLEELKAKIEEGNS